MYAPFRIPGAQLKTIILNETQAYFDKGNSTSKTAVRHIR